MVAQPFLNAEVLSAISLKGFTEQFQSGGSGDPRSSGFKMVQLMRAIVVSRVGQRAPPWGCPRRRVACTPGPPAAVPRYAKLGPLPVYRPGVPRGSSYWTATGRAASGTPPAVGASRWASYSSGYQGPSVRSRSELKF